MLNIQLLSYIQFLIAGILLYFIYFSIKIKKNRLALIFSIMTFFAFQFTIGYGIELFAKNKNIGLLAIKYEYHGLSFLPIFWFIFAYKFYNNKYPSSLIIALISIIPFITYFLVMTNESTFLFKYCNLKDSFFAFIPSPTVSLIDKISTPLICLFKSIPIISSISPPKPSLSVT